MNRYPFHQTYSDFIVYVDESGDHSLTTIDPRYPVFVLSFCVFRKETYNLQIAPALRALKFASFGHDMVVLHESEIRRRRGAFEHLSQNTCAVLMAGLNRLIADADFQLIAVAIDKRTLNPTENPAPHIYHLALEHGLNSLFDLLTTNNQQQTVTHLVFEARGAREDLELELEFRRLCDQAAFVQQGIGMEIVIANKKTNAEGLQLADLTARPIGLSVLKPEQENRAVDVLEAKFYRGGTDDKKSYGMKILS